MPFRSALARTRSLQVVGRSDERAAFEALLDGVFRVLLVEGLGGVGKSTLLRLFADQATARGVEPIRLDLNGMAPTVGALLDRLATRTPLVLRGGELLRTDAPGAPFVLLVDTFEAAMPIAGWLRDVLLPALPDGASLVVAGQTTPATAWRTDPALRLYVRVLTLGPLSDADAAGLLERRNVPEAVRPAILAFAGGHPLALALAADAANAAGEAGVRGLAFDPNHADLIAALLDRLLRLVPDATAQHTLYAAALVLYLDEGLLAAMLGLDAAQARERFAWLLRLSFVDAGERGLVLHDLVRRLLVADFAWRDADAMRTFSRRARAAFSQRLADAPLNARRALLTDYLFLHRQHPVIGPLLHQLQGQWSGRTLVPGPAEPDDREALAAMVQRFEGDEAARWFRYGFDTQPQTVRVYRDADGGRAGMLVTLTLRSDTDDDGDPAVQAALRFLATNAPLRPGEHALFFRFWMDADAHQGLSAVQSLVFVDTIHAYLATPGLAFSFLPTADPARWALVLALADLDLLPDASFEQDGQPVAVFGHDWRRVPPSDWLDRVARIGLGDEASAAHALPVRVVLTHEAFAEAVRDAFRDVLRPDRLRTNALARTRLVVERATAHAETPERALLALLRATADRLAAAPRTAKHHRALVATYFAPASSQEEAAEALDVPFSSFRRHLRAGLDAVTAMLWDDELGGAPRPAANQTGTVATEP